MILVFLVWWRLVVIGLRTRGILWDIFYTYLSLLDSLKKFLILLDEFLDLLGNGLMKSN